MTKPPYNSDPLDQPAPPSKVSAYELANQAVLNDPPRPRFFAWVDIVRSADIERRNRLKLLSQQAQSKALQRDLAPTEHARTWYQYEYDLIHDEINRIMDEHRARPLADLMSRKNISPLSLEKETPARKAMYLTKNYPHK